MSSSKQPWILGISASHNGAVCLLKGDKIVVAIQEERLLGFKRARITLGQPSLATNYCLQYAGIEPESIDCVVLSSQFPLHHPSNSLNTNPTLQRALKNAHVLSIGHHSAHAYSAFATSGFDEAAVLVIDGMGSPYQDLTQDEKGVVIDDNVNGCEIISLYSALDTSLSAIEKHLVFGGRWLNTSPPGACMRTFGSLGAIFSIVSEQIFGSIFEAGKVMGLAPYGSPTIPIDDFFTIEDGRFIFHDHVSRRFSHAERWPQHKEAYSDLACSAQAAVEAGILYLTKRLRKQTSTPNLAYAGGVALNSVANERIVRESGFDNIYFIPSAEDSGAAVGAAYYGLWKLGARNTKQVITKDSFGAKYSSTDIDAAIVNAPWAEVVNNEATVNDVADLLIHNKIIGWFSEGSELGPRSLGQRSILCDPRREDAKKFLNARVKHREGFRPFAPLVLAEEVDRWFELEGTAPESPFMLRVLKFKSDAKKIVPGVVHCDGTGRVQTVTAEHNGLYYELLKAFFVKTGVPILINTSLNVMGEPIVETPGDALWALAMTRLDYCVMGKLIIGKKKRLRSALDLYPYFLEAEHLHRASSLVEHSGTFPVSTPWGDAYLPLEDPLTRKLASEGLTKLINGKTKAKSILKTLGRDSDGITESALLRSLVQLRRGRVIGLSLTPFK